MLRVGQEARIRDIFTRSVETRFAKSPRLLLLHHSAKFTSLKMAVKVAERVKSSRNSHGWKVNLVNLLIGTSKGIISAGRLETR